MANTSVNIGGSGFMLLTITFVILKALGYITWSWWLVFLPLWGSLVIVLLVLLILVIVAMVVN